MGYWWEYHGHIIGIFMGFLTMGYSWNINGDSKWNDHCDRKPLKKILARCKTWLRNPHDKYGGLAVKNHERKAGDFPTSHLFSLAKAISGMGYHGDATSVSEKRCSSWFYHVLSTIEGNICLYDPVTKHSQKGNF